MKSNIEIISDLSVKTFARVVGVASVRNCAKEIRQKKTKICVLARRKATLCSCTDLESYASKFAVFV